MFKHNANFQIVNLSGSENLADRGWLEPSGSPIHQVFCTSGGSIEITAVGGGKATFTLSQGQSVNVLVGAYTINSGTFVGFRPHDNRPGYNPQGTVFARNT